MELPRSLQPWSQWLELFPREILTSVGQMIQRLDRAVGPLRVRSETGSGEPDGFDGLTRRGSYERLLLTEWLLADEMPEEFVRRAVMGEHAFYQVARREPAGSRLSVALFDAGPNQLGSPRLAHIAALIVLARRAEAAGADFHWGVLQEAEFSLHTATPETMQILLNNRCLREATSEDLTRWEERIDLTGKSDDFWIIGGTRLERLLPERRVSRLLVRDPLEPDDRCIAATVHSPGRPTLEIRLPLPEEKHCGRLLRDPFGILRSAPRRVAGRFAPTSNFVWAQNGTKLIARCADNALVVYPVPNSPSAGAGRPKIYTPKTVTTPILAAGRVHKAILTLQHNENYFPGTGIQVDCIGGQHGSLPLGSFSGVESGMKIDEIQENWLGGCFAGPSERDYFTNIYALLPGNELICVGGPHPAGANLSRVDFGVYAIAPVRESNRLVYAAMTDMGWQLTSLGPNGNSETLEWGCNEDAGDVYFGCGGSLEHPNFGMPALELSAEEWVIITDEDNFRIEVAHDQLVVGVIGPRRYGLSPGLIVMEDDWRSLRIIGNEWAFDLPKANADIVHASASHADPYIAYSTEAGEIVIYSLAYEADLFRMEASSR